jgi:tetratricopeptide (TPR) repeat protein
VASCAQALEGSAAVAACSAATGNPDVTLARCSEALEDDSLSPAQRATSLTRRGLAWFSKRELGKASADLEAAVAADPRSQAAWNALGVATLQAGEPERAIAAFGKALAIQPGLASALANRGNAWLAKGDATQALADLDRAVALAPARLELALTLRGKAHLALGDASAAEADFAAALARNSGYSNALEGRGYARFVQGDFAAAAEAFGQQWQERPDAESAIAWILALRRAGAPANSELARANPPGAQGEAPGLALLAGTLSPDRLLESATDHDPQVQKARRCAAEFVVGEWYLLRAERPQARTHLAAARAACALSQPEYAASGAELARLGAP